MKYILLVLMLALPTSVMSANLLEEILSNVGLGDDAAVAAPAETATEESVTDETVIIEETTTTIVIETDGNMTTDQEAELKKILEDLERQQAEFDRMFEQQQREFEIQQQQLQQEIFQDLENREANEKSIPEVNKIIQYKREIRTRSSRIEEIETELEQGDAPLYE